MSLFLAESHILEDVNKCIIALREQDADNLDHAAGAIRGRAARVAHIVTGEMDSYEPGAYTEGVMQNVQLLTNAGMYVFFCIWFFLCRENLSEPNSTTEFNIYKGEGISLQTQILSSLSVLCVVISVFCVTFRFSLCCSQ